MAPTAREILTRLRTAPGRKRLVLGAVFKTWPVLFPLASAYRRTLVRRTRLVAVVGSFGKTTTTRAVTAALGLRSDPRAGWNAGGYLALGLLRIRPGARHAALEVGIGRRGLMKRYASIVRPDVAVVTSIGSEHHESLGTLEDTRNEKADMVRALRPDGLAVLNGDDPHVLWMRGETRAPVVTFGLASVCDVRASDVSTDIRSGTRFTLHATGEAREVSTRLFGQHMVHPILAAVAVALHEGFPLDEILPRLEQLEPTARRLERVVTQGGAYLLVDTHKAALETILRSLETVEAVAAERKIVVLGDIEEPVGSQGPLYKALGARLAAVATRVVFVGGEKAHASLAGGARSAGMPKERVTYAGRSPRRAAELVMQDLRAGDLVLIKGRSTQRLERVAFHLVGQFVPCDLETCGLKPGCSACPTMRPGRRQAARSGRRTSVAE